MAIMRQHSQGRRLLLAVLQRTSAREVAARCRVAHSCVSEWSSGDAAPSQRPRLSLAEIYGIPRDAWERLPSAPTKPR